jgi:hypothetical protein
MGNKLLILLIAEYAIIALAYLISKDWARALYFAGAIILSLGLWGLYGCVKNSNKDN